MAMMKTEISPNVAQKLNEWKGQLVTIETESYADYGDRFGFQLHGTLEAPTDDEQTWGVRVGEHPSEGTQYLRFLPSQISEIEVTRSGRKYILIRA
jgi:hypothetical protein